MGIYKKERRTMEMDIYTHTHTHIYTHIHTHIHIYVYIYTLILKISLKVNYLNKNNVGFVTLLEVKGMVIMAKKAGRREIKIYYFKILTLYV